MIPQELKALSQWVVHKDKVPYNPGNPKVEAKANDPKTWGSYSKALVASKINGFNGIGFEFSAEDPFAGIDLDKCRDKDTGVIEPWALEIIQQIASYTEISPSGTGVHILIKGKLPAGGNRKGKIEMYDQGRYFTMTGQHLPQTPLTICSRQSELEALHARIFIKPQLKVVPSSPGSTLNISDQELIDKAMSAANGAKFQALWTGNYSAYGSQSEADQALCNMLAFWCGNDPARIDRLFRQSGLYRGKWDRVDYSNKTIQKAIEISGSRPTMTATATAEKVNPTKKTMVVIEGGHNLSDMGNALRFVDMHGENVRYCYPWESWVIWDGQRWQRDTSGQVDRLAKETVRGIYREAGNCDDDNRRAALRQHAGRCEGEAKRKAMLSSAKCELPISPDDFDKNHWLFNCQNGTLDLQSGDLLPHTKEHFITKLSPVDYDINAECPTWWNFLLRIMGNKEALVFFLQRAAGYSMTGGTNEQCMFIPYGLGANGKSTYLNILKKMFGEYSQHAETDTFMLRKNDNVRNDLAALRGSRLVTAIETEKGKSLAEAMVKQMTGGDPITARFLFSEFFTFMPTFKIWLAANHKPIIRGTDHAIWRRIKLIPFTVSIPENEQDKDLPEKLTEELPGILKWCLTGCLSWQDIGLDIPPEVKAATAEYREEMDMLADFLNECCIVAPGLSTKAKELYSAYTSWAESNGEKHFLSQRSFGLTLTERGIKKDRGPTGVWYRYGVGLKEN